MQWMKIEKESEIYCLMVHCILANKLAGEMMVKQHSGQPGDD